MSLANQSASWFSCVRFWFKPAWSSGTGPDPGSFLYLGNSSKGFDFGVSSGGNNLRLQTATNSSSYTNFTTSYTFASGKWYQIVLNYSPTVTAVYVNGATCKTLGRTSSRSPKLSKTPEKSGTPGTRPSDFEGFCKRLNGVGILTNGSGIDRWPNSTDRTNGLVIGNNLSGNQSVKGHLDELETFNYQLSSNEIARSFNIVTNVDSDLNGVADIIEDLALSTNQPFIGTPFVVTGVMEAEQFDKGGAGTAYSNTSANAACDYRATGMFITNCTDKGGGYCLDQMRSNEWVKYTIDVRVAQNYWIEPRVAGIGTNGVFKIEFSTNGVLYTNTGNLTIGTTNWTNQAVKNIGLAAGTNVMRLLMLTNGLVNGASTNAVGRFNYIWFPAVFGGIDVHLP